MVAIHILSQKSNLLHSLAFQLLYFLEDGVETAASLSSPYEWHNAEGAHVVAASHYREKGSHAILIFSDRSDICVCFFSTQQCIHLELIFIQGCRDQSRQVAIGIRTTDHMDTFFKHLLLQPLGHASQNAHNFVGSDLLDPLVYFLLG